MTNDTPPRRRVQLAIIVDADTWDGAVRCLDRNIAAIEERATRDGVDLDAPGVSSGVSATFAYQLDVDDDAHVGADYYAQFSSWALARMNSEGGSQ